MGTVSKQIADRIIAGEFPEDDVVKIVKYMTPEGGEAYGVITRREDPDRYHASPFVIAPEVYWEAGK